MVDMYRIIGHFTPRHESVHNIYRVINTYLYGLLIVYSSQDETFCANAPTA